MNENENTKDVILDLKNTQELCKTLMQTPHYRKMGDEGIFAIVQKAQSLGINPLEALNGGMYFVKGKVEMQAILMAKMIRSKGHSITMGKDSDKTKCILHGRRKDNGDTWRSCFTIEDAQRAGIYSQNGPWGKYPEDMLYSRALSRLARQLFPDVIGNCYIEGEISQDKSITGVSEQEDSLIGVEVEMSEKKELKEISTITKGQLQYLEKILEDDEEYRDRLLTWVKTRFNIEGLEQLPEDAYLKIRDKAEERMFALNEKEVGEASADETIAEVEMF